AHRLLGQALARAGMRPEASRHLRRALKLAANAGDAHGTARAHYDLARMGRNGDHQIALTHATQALRLFDALANPVWRAEALAEVGWHQARLGRYAEARDLCEQALELCREHAHRQGVAGTLDVLGYVAHRSAQYHTTPAHYREPLALRRDPGAPHDAADTLDHLVGASAPLSHGDEPARRDSQPDEPARRPGQCGRRGRQQRQQRYDQHAVEVVQRERAVVLRFGERADRREVELHHDGREQQAGQHEEDPAHGLRLSIDNSVDNGPSLGRWPPPVVRRPAARRLRRWAYSATRGAGRASAQDRTGRRTRRAAHGARRRGSPWP